ncbi:Outer membrane protein assembly factor BamB, contains PQQ-like beta-propeller repeat [Shimia gijangensis]|uniref:Outer membrane protein assembly factor BamB, contains PQQ-like beta-propeller repeat n=1 Tax=Shimia gijangensis TaxID=1470563 RepID=A0A1M6E843_9RHOB|nr:PQQ-like beta-propeller repeat protein [Shimia gijangensis]SHI81583.1 Outer membrane protein assembly factor BamB, contains PQQ-like beta-propeller repeat [Shimia gijangensis]
MRTRNLVLALIGASILIGCAEKQVILPGKREELRGGEVTTANDLQNQTKSISLPGQSKNASWTHRPGSQMYRTSNAAFSAPATLMWSASIGKGSSRKQRITADPVVADGRVFTMDSEGNLSGFTTAGLQIWTRNLTPPRDKSTDAAGGGLAYNNGKLFVTTGFGRLEAVDPKTGKMIWEQRLEAIGSGTPTVYGNLVYLVSGDERGWAIDTETGKVAWQLNSVPSVTNVQSPSAPAVNDRLVVFPFGSGELQATFRRGGLRLWDAGVAGERLGRAVSKIGDISGDPVISGSTVYAANHSGRLVALDLETGERKWTAEEGALSPVWPVGNSVFLVSDRNKLVRLNASDGAHVWSVDLPLFVKDKPKKQASVYSHFGPILAGGRLIVASSDGLLRSFDPASGALLSSVEIPGGAASNPVVASGTLYVVGGKGELHAFR